MFSLRRSALARAAVALAAAVTLLGLEVAGVSAANVAPAGQYQGPSFSFGDSPSGSKPQSKLWFADGTWWSVMHAASPGTGLSIYRLDASSQAWQSTGVVVDPRNGTRSDVLWDGSKLYVATHIFSESPGSGPSNLYRFSYDALRDVHTLDPGFPAPINDSWSETLVLAKDSTNQLWATWTERSLVMVNRSTALGDDRWGSPFVLPGGTGLTPDDISSVVAFAGHIGIMWSDQSAQQMRFVTRSDDALDDTTFSEPEVAVGGDGMADDHVNLKADASGRVYAATKTERSTSSEPSLLLNVRDATGRWTTTVFSTVADDQTRPIVVLNEERRRLYYFATWDQDGGVIYKKETSLDEPAFAPGRGTPVIEAGDVNNATAGKQSVTGATGLVVQATADASGRYWHHWNPSPK